MFEDRPRAKLNLTLKVVGTRDDGYHELRSVFLRVGLADRLSLTLGGADGADTLSLYGVAGVPSHNNLVTRALNAVRARAEIPLPTLDATLHKQIPAAAGLGGGSSDCASAIRLAQAIWGIGLSKEQEWELGASLGSDVPFFLADTSLALVEGRGERVSPLRWDGDAGVLTVTPPVELTSGRVFARYDDLGGAEPSDTSMDLLEFATLAEAASALRDSNDLWAAAASLAPGLEELRDSLEVVTQRPWLMSGSGPTLFAIYPAVDEAAESGREIVRRVGPAHDAQINAVDLVGPDPLWRFP
jgi:4-diphosphocytidyl-2-C-methyl-D-erythritol kinase